MQGNPPVGAINWDNVPAQRVTDGIDRQIVWGDNVMMVRLSMAKGASVQSHAHPNEQMTYILKGKITFTYGHQMENTAVLSAGDILHLPANVPHSAVCQEDTIDLDIFSPPRRDWLKAGGDAYFSAPLPQPDTEAAV
jgi:quercetin dioxygenase-like cupin family protein